MSKLSVFNFLSLNGYFKGPNEDISWAHQDAEDDYAAEMLNSESRLLFGRVTYEMMASYWPTPQALKASRTVAEGMNNAEKIVFSRTLKNPDWKNTRVISNNILEEISAMKQKPGKDMTLLGSGSIVTQFAQRGLIDEYQLLVHPVALGDGTPLLKGIKQKLTLKLTKTRAFKSGNVLLCYQPVEKT